MNRAATILGLCAVLALASPNWAQSESESGPADSGQADSSTSRPSDSSNNNGTRANRADRNERRNTRRNRDRQNQGGDSLSSESGSSAVEAWSRDFEVLTRRSIFVKGRPAASNGLGGSGNFAAAQAEDELVFNGVTVIDGKPAGFIEDTSTHDVQIVGPGQSIAAGKISKITLDTLEYTASGGRSVEVKVGQNLRGQDAWNQTYGISTGDASAVVEQPTDAAAAALIQKLKERRQRELNGGVSATGSASGAVSGAAAGPTTAPSAPRP